jgi:hypothetical protein
VRPWREVPVTMLDVTWVGHESWKNRQRGVLGGCLCFSRGRIRRTIALQGHTHSSRLRLWDMVSPLTPFFWVAKHRETAVTVLSAAEEIRWGDSFRCVIWRLTSRRQKECCPWSRCIHRAEVRKRRRCRSCLRRLVPFRRVGWNCRLS